MPPYNIINVRSVFIPDSYKKVTSYYNADGRYSEAFYELVKDDLGKGQNPPCPLYERGDK